MAGSMLTLEVGGNCEALIAQSSPADFGQCRELCSHLGRQHWRYHEVSRQLHLVRQHASLLMVHGHAVGLVKKMIKGDMLVALPLRLPSRQRLRRQLLLAPASCLLQEEPAGLLLQ